MSVELMVLFITIIGIIIGNIIWSVYNIRQNKKNRKILQIQSKFPAKKRLFKNWYVFAKNLMNKIEFTKSHKSEELTILEFRIRKKEWNGYEDLNSQKLTILRLKKFYEDAQELCGYRFINYDFKEVDVVPTYGTVPTIKVYGEQNPSKVFYDDCIMIPNYSLSKKPEDIKTDFLNEIIEEFKKSKSSISQNLTILKKDGLIFKHYVRTINITDPYLIISITEKGLSLVNKILFEGLNNEEIKKLQNN